MQIISKQYLLTHGIRCCNRDDGGLRNIILHSDLHDMKAAMIVNSWRFCKLQSSITWSPCKCIIIDTQLWNLKFRLEISQLESNRLFELCYSIKFPFLCVTSHLHTMNCNKKKTLLESSSFFVPFILWHLHRRRIEICMLPADIYRSTIVLRESMRWTKCQQWEEKRIWFLFSCLTESYSQIEIFCCLFTIYSSFRKRLSSIYPTDRVKSNKSDANDRMITSSQYVSHSRMFEMKIEDVPSKNKCLFSHLPNACFRI